MSLKSYLYVAFTNPKRILHKAKELSIKYFSLLYLSTYVPIKAYEIRHKDKIKVYFHMIDLSCWKTEELYKAMLSHPRFEPHILVSTNFEEDDREKIFQYLDSKGYSYDELGEGERIYKKFPGDIIIYQKPYDGTYPINHRLWHNLRFLSICLPYGIRCLSVGWVFEQRLLNMAWQVYFENLLTWKESVNKMTNKSRNGYVTGLPVIDENLRDRTEFEDPWRPQLTHKKRIIWAPHHSLADGDGLDYSTFLRYYDFILELAEKYSDKVQWAFKPHPLLFPKLVKLWGKDKAQEYFDKWESLSNAQYESGKYVGLFKHSDAMIHDCSSFTLEYLQMGKPVMFLRKHDVLDEEVLQQCKIAYSLHQHGKCEKDIEDFVVGIINGKTYNVEEIKKFRSDYLLPPWGRTSVENIIECILNPKKSREMRGLNISKS